MNEQIKTLREKAAAIKAELLVESKRLFEEETSKIFTEFPEITEFSWTQYTPYFNDGDTCVFRANTDDLEINGELTEYDFKEKIWCGKGEVPNPGYNPRLCAGYAAIKAILSQLDEDFFNATFRDHVKVTVTANGATADEYSHD